MTNASARRTDHGPANLLLFSGPISPLRRMLERVVTARRRLVERVLPLGLLALAAISVPVMILSSSGLGRLEALREEKRRTDQAISQLSQQIRQLRAEVLRVRSDPAAVERVARDELGLVRKTEVVFQFRD